MHLPRAGSYKFAWRVFPFQTARTLCPALREPYHSWSAMQGLDDQDRRDWSAWFGRREGDLRGPNEPHFNALPPPLPQAFQSLTPP